MRVVYTALIEDQPEKAVSAARVRTKQSTWGQRASYKNHLEAVKEYKDRIEALQVHFPGWVPKFVK